MLWNCLINFLKINNKVLQMHLLSSSKWRHFRLKLADFRQTCWREGRGWRKKKKKVGEDCHSSHCLLPDPSSELPAVISIFIKFIGRRCLSMVNLSLMDLFCAGMWLISPESVLEDVVTVGPLGITVENCYKSLILKKKEKIITKK